MPQASDELRARWGGDGGIGPEKAEDFLKSRNVRISDRFIIYLPRNADEDERTAAAFLCDEWDFGCELVD